MRWVMSKIESPLSFRFLIKPSNLLASVTPRAAVGSSMIRIFDWKAMARAQATIWR